MQEWCRTDSVPCEVNNYADSECDLRVGICYVLFDWTLTYY